MSEVSDGRRAPRRRRAIAASAVAIVLVFAFGRFIDAPIEPDIPPSGVTVGAPPPDRALRFVVIGDFGEGNTDESAIAAAIRSFDQTDPLDGFVTTGDDVYDSGDPADFDAAWRQPFGWVQDSKIPIVASLGNHDVRTDGGRPVMELLGMPGRWYTETFGPVQFVVLDANDPTNPDQLTFLRESLATSTARWQVVVFHQPAFSCGPHGSTAEVDILWVPVFERYGVDLVLNGHDHDYQRFAPIDGVTYIVSGGGGSALYTELDNCDEGTPKPLVAIRVHHFLALTAWGSGLRVVGLSADLQPIDAVTLR
ncbi:MAG TPA: metallophosphoesterase [Actinomycetota bacterium]|nr:metallophosphoesterase [Actinomycetota bacterium]